MREVPGIGDPNAKIALVGEAPGEKEALAGEPFVGPMGQLLNKMLNQARIIRGEVWITNVIKIRPPNNNLVPTYFSDVKKTKPTQALLDQRELLKQDLLELKPNVVVAVGGVALWALTGRFGVLKLRGSILESTLIPGLKIIVTLHPRFVNQVWNPWRGIVPLDLKKAVKESEYPEIRRPHRDFIIAPTFEQVIEELYRLEYATDLSVDIETRGQNYEVLSCIGFSDDPSRAICIPMTKGLRANYWTLEEEMHIWRLIASLLENPKIRKVGQNLAYDMAYLIRYYKIDFKDIDINLDTMVAHREIFPETKRSLDFLASIWTDEPYWKDEGKSHSGRVTDEQLWNYNCKDVAVTLEIAWKLEAALNEAGLWEQYMETISFQKALVYMTVRGVRFNKEDQRHLINEYDAKISKAQEALELAIGPLYEKDRHPLNVASSPQMQRFLYIVLGLPVQYKGRGKDRKPTADDEALKKLRRNFPKFASILDVIMAIRAMRTMYSRYITVETDRLDGRLRCAWRLAGTKSLVRLSSAESPFGGGTNLQTMPKRTDKEGIIRRLFEPDPGYFLAAPDLSQAESRVVAYLSDDVQVIQEYELKLDAHAEFAARLHFHLTGGLREEFLAKKITEPDYFKSMRNLGKILRHARNYGMTWKGLMSHAATHGVILNAERAKALLAAADAATPMLKIWHDRIQHEMSMTRTLTTPLGKRRVFGERFGDDLFRQAYAHIPQSHVGHITLKGMRDIDNQLGKYGVALLLQVHDELVMQIPLNNPELAWRAREMMEFPVPIKDRILTIPSELKVGMNWSDMTEVGTKEELIQVVERMRHESGS